MDDIVNVGMVIENLVQCSLISDIKFVECRTLSAY